MLFNQEAVKILVESLKFIFVSLSETLKKPKKETLLFFLFWPSSGSYCKSVFGWQSSALRVVIRRALWPEPRKWVLVWAPLQSLCGLKKSSVRLVTESSSVPGVDNLFLDGPGSKYFRLPRPRMVSVEYSTLVLRVCYNPWNVEKPFLAPGPHRCRCGLGSATLPSCDDLGSTSQKRRENK